MLPAQPLTVLDEFTVVLPQRYRARVLGVVPLGERTFVILIQDFERDEAGTLAPVWRLYRYDAPGAMALEVCRFSQSPDAPVHAVHMTADRGAIYLLFDAQLMRVDVDRREVEGVCRIRLPPRPDPRGGRVEVRAVAVHGSVLALCVALADEELSLHWIPLGEGAARGAPWDATRGERIAFSPDGTLYALDLLEISAWDQAKVVARRDVESTFERWYSTPRELLAVTDDGRILVGAGKRFVALSPGLAEPRRVFDLPDISDALAWIDGTKKVLSSRVDDATATLLLQTFSP